MGPKPHPKPLHLAVGVILAVAVAVAAESRAHSYGLALRTVRESLGMQSLWLGGALAFAVLFTVLASWRVGRGWLLLAPPAPRPRVSRQTAQRSKILYSNRRLFP